MTIYERRMNEKKHPDLEYQIEKKKKKSSNIKYPKY